jgi:hypothetical protein
MHMLWIKGGDLLVNDNDISENPFTMIELSPHWLPAVRDGLHLIHPKVDIYGI